ncbi:hypothetical protein SDC9_150022 [bioreactor metagenome]|uniref:Uncharacterized protein n=1 Tax=bioreactor metagenome TaxID=1076179 RepID=A0A645EL85_9ZZZZ
MKQFEPGVGRRQMKQQCDRAASADGGPGAPDEGFELFGIDRLDRLEGGKVKFFDLFDRILPKRGIVEPGSIMSEVGADDQQCFRIEDAPQCRRGPAEPVGTQFRHDQRQDAEFLQRILQQRIFDLGGVFFGMHGVAPIDREAFFQRQQCGFVERDRAEGRAHQRTFRRHQTVPESVTVARRQHDDAMKSGAHDPGDAAERGRRAVTITGMRQNQDIRRRTMAVGVRNPFGVLVEHVTQLIGAAGIPAAGDSA